MMLNQKGTTYGKDPIRKRGGALSIRQRPSALFKETWGAPSGELGNYGSRPPMSAERLKKQGRPVRLSHRPALFFSVLQKGKIGYVLPPVRSQVWLTTWMGEPSR